MNSEPKIGEFLLRLSEDPELRDAYYDDPSFTAAQFGLTDEQQEIVRSGDIDRIEDAVRGEYPDRDLFFLVFRPVFKRP